MALAATTIWEIESGGNDATNSGGFDPGQTAGMFADGAATSALTVSPVFTSASYNFVAGDVGAWLYISSGTNWTAGWYKIFSVGSNAATLTADIGTAVLKNQLGMNTANGCATVTSPSAATWTIDYSQQTSPKWTYTDLSSTGVGLTVSSAAHPFGKQYVGNSLVVTGGTNFLTGRYVIASISGTTATVVGPTNIHNNAGTNSDGTGSMGGCLASPSMPGGFAVNGNAIFVKSATYSITSATINISGGVFSLNTGTGMIGYNTNRHFTNTDTKPIWQTNVSTATTYTNANGHVYNIAFDGNNQTASKAIGAQAEFLRCTFTRFNTAGTASIFANCSMTACSAAIFTANSLMNCEAYSNTATPIIMSGAGAVAVDSLSYSNTGATTDGIQITTFQNAINCTTYANGRDGITCNVGPPTNCMVINCHSEQNVANDYNLPSASSNGQTYLINSSYYFTGSGAGAAGARLVQIGVTALTRTAFNNAAGLDFSLNNNLGGGAALRDGAYVGSFPHAAGHSALDIGAMQSSLPAGYPTVFGYRAKRG